MSVEEEENLQFSQCVGVVLRGWTALQLAIQHGFGGAHSVEKGEWMAGAIADCFFKNKDLKYYEVSEMLEDLMQDEFNTELDDNSQIEIGTLLCKCYELYTTNRKSELIKLIGHAPVAAVTQSESRLQQGNDDDEDDDEDINMDCNCSVTTHLKNWEISEEPSVKEAEELNLHGDKVANDSSNIDMQDDGWTEVSKKSKTKSRKP